MNPFQKVFYTTFLTGLWTLIYVFVHYNIRVRNVTKQNELDLKNRIVSMMHGFAAFWLSMLTIIIHPSAFKQPNNLTVNIILMISLSYFIYDTALSLYFKLLDRNMIFHHFSSIFIFSFALTGLRGSYYAIIGLVIGQVSNFCYHMRIVLKTLGFKYTKIYDLIQNIYIFLYVLARGVFSLIFLLIPVLLQKKAHFIFSILIVGMQLQSLKFIYDMLGLMETKWKKHLQMTTKDIDYDWFSEDKEKLSQLSFYKEKP